MSTTSATRNVVRRPWLVMLCLFSAGLFAAGLSGVLSIAWGYALFVVAGLLLGCGTVIFAVFALTRAGDTGLMRQGFTITLALGACAYVLSLCAMGGTYTHEAFAGRMEWRWILFGPCILAALIALDYGLYRKLVRNNLPTWRHYYPYIARENADPKSMRRTLIDEVVLHRSLLRTSKIRWLRHTLILWGFVAMFLTELLAVVVRDGFPAFGWRDIWREPNNPVPLGFAFVYDVTGLMVLIGCVIALGWRVAVNRTPERKYSDTPTTIFLLFVIVTGFLVEGLRIAPTLGDPVHRLSFVGLTTAGLLTVTGTADAKFYNPLWVIHVLAACAFIAYVPVMRLIHSCATPMGRLMTSQKHMLAAKKRGVLGAMLIRPAAAVQDRKEGSHSDLH